jgi:ABC-2 type transport system permease protein
VILRPVRAIIARELTRTLRQRGRLLSALVRPLLWLLVIGSGVESVVAHGAGPGYRAFLVPGLLAMSLLFGAMLAALSLVHDKESGVLRMLLVAPFHHAWIVVARILSAATVAVVQAALLVLVLAACGHVGAGTCFPSLLLGVVLTALAAACLGMLVAVYVQSLENFAVMMNLVIFPVFFLSGALYPVQSLPPWLGLVAMANPFSYGVDLLKHATAGDLPQRFAPDFSLGLDAGVLIGFSILAAALAAIRFSDRSTIAALTRLVGGDKAR